MLLENTAAVQHASIQVTGEKKNKHHLCVSNVDGKYLSPFGTFCSHKLNAVIVFEKLSVGRNISVGEMKTAANRRESIISVKIVKKLRLEPYYYQFCITVLSRFFSHLIR